MIEYIVIGIVILIALAIWFAAFIDNADTVMEGIMTAIWLPVLIVTMVSAVIYVIYCFGKVFGV